MVGSYPRLIAASYALHRLPAPRHPPCALSNLTTIILASLAIRPAWRPYGTGGKNPSRLAAGSVVTPQTPPNKLRSGFLLATLPLFNFQRTRHPCRSQARKPSMLQRLRRLRSALTLPLQIVECRLHNSGPRDARDPDLSRHSAIFNLHSAIHWWSRWDSNPRPPGCKPGALPTELRPPSHCRFQNADCRIPVPRRTPSALFCILQSSICILHWNGGPRWSRTTDLALIRGAL